jgi:hypothetical protein
MTTNATSIIFSRTIGAGSPIFSGTTLIVSGTFSGQMTSTYGGYINSNATPAGAFLITGSPFASFAGAVRSNITSRSGILTGSPFTYTVQAAGTGYINGAAGVSGGTGTAANVTLTTSAGAITAAVPLSANGSNSVGSGYVVNDVLTVVQAGGSGGQIKVTAIDGYGGIISVVADSRSFTDATSNNNYPSFYSAPTYTLSGSSASTYFGYYNPTYSSFGSGTKGGIVIVPTGTLSSIGSATLDSTLKLVGSGSVPTFRTVGTGTTTNYSYRAFQSDGTTEILSLKDNGDFSVGLSTSSIGLYGGSPTAQGSVGATLVNNVTSGGTTGQIDDFTSLTVYATDAPTIRNDIYQLSKKLNALEAKLKLLSAVKD